MAKDYTDLHDPNAEYTMRELSAETMGADGARPAPRDLEITDVQTTMVDGNFPWTLVRVYTDAGVVGTGEAYWGAGVPELVERMKPFVVGENPLDIDRLFEHLVQKMSGEGSVEGVTVTAISGIEVALHDLAGKVLGVPAYQLLGGSTATRSASTVTATPRRRPTPRRARTRPSASSRNWATTP
jgi:gluconate/galactonate dehydratase